MTLPDAERNKREQALREHVLREQQLRSEVSRNTDIRFTAPTAWSSVSDSPAALADARHGKRTLGGILRRAAKVFGGILGLTGAVALANALTAGLVNQMFGLVPRTISHAWGIVLHPLLHANAGHLAMNAVGLVLMGGTVFLRSEKDFWRVTLTGIVLGGGATWLVGRESLHVGASGLVFAYLGYLLTTGWFDRKLTSVALSVGATVLWGSALLGLSPLQNGISWELHLFGLMGGVIGAWWRKRASQP